MKALAVLHKSVSNSGYVINRISELEHSPLRPDEYKPEHEYLFSAPGMKVRKFSGGVPESMMPPSVFARLSKTGGGELTKVVEIPDPPESSEDNGK